MPLTCVLFSKFSEVINGALDEFFPLDSGVQIIAEPGRYYVESVFTLAVNVIAKRVDIVDMDKDSGNILIRLLKQHECILSSMHNLMTNMWFI